MQLRAGVKPLLRRPVDRREATRRGPFMVEDASRLVTNMRAMFKAPPRGIIQDNTGSLARGC